MNPKPQFWWRRARKTDKPVWHFMKECPSQPWPESKEAVVAYDRPRSGTLCDWCQNLQKKAAK